MNPQQIELVRSSWALVLPQREQAAALFYQRLFALDPAIRPMFTGDLRAQGAMLMTALNLVVQGLDQLERVLPTAQQLALRHVGYGVQPSHYDTVGEALLWTLRSALGAVANDGVMAAWVQAFGTLAGVMKAAAYPPVAPGSPPPELPSSTPATEWQAQALSSVRW